jgi:hypothetical protein
VLTTIDSVLVAISIIGSETTTSWACALIIPITAAGLFSVTTGKLADIDSGPIAIT